jgi:LytS/YehU family sensor histidine kinase
LTHIHILIILDLPKQISPECIMELLFCFIKVMSVFFFAAYLYCTSPRCKPLTTDSIRMRNTIYLCLFFSAILILSTYMDIEDLVTL